MDALLLWHRLVGNDKVQFDLAARQTHEPLSQFPKILRTGKLRKSPFGFLGQPDFPTAFRMLDDIKR